MKITVATITIVLALFVSNATVAQKILVGAGGGYATFSMSDTKDYNQWVQNNLPFTPVVTDNFPAWYFLNAEALYCFPRLLAAGLKISTTSTGSRLSLADYSGEYTFDNQQNGWFSSVKLLLGKAPGTHSGSAFSLEGGMAFSTMTFDEEIVVADLESSDEMEFRARGFFIQPGLNYMQLVGEHLALSANVSYYLGFESGYFVKGNKDRKITNDETGEKIKPNWNGLRVGLVLYWKL